MHRIDSAYREVDKFGAGKDGYTEGDPPTTAATRPTDDHFNAFQEELCGLVENQKGALVKADNTQIESAAKNMLAQLAASNWLERAPTVAKNIRLRCVANNGAGISVAVGFADGVDAYILRSVDNLIWTEQAPTVAKNIGLKGVAYAPGLWVAAGHVDGANPYMLSSIDALTWTIRVPAVAKAVMVNSVAYGNNLWVAVGDVVDGTHPYILTSPDGGVADAWTIRTPPVAKAIVLNSVAYGNNLWVAVGNVVDGTHPYILTSADGGVADPWVIRTPPVARAVVLRGVAHDDSHNLWTAVGDAGGPAGKSYILTSTDGGVIDPWTEHAAPKSLALYGIAHNGSGLWMATGADAGEYAHIIVSVDGENWTELPPNPKDEDLYSVVYSAAHKNWTCVGETDGTDAYIITSLKTPF